jgi:hypothetical protein
MRIRRARWCFAAKKHYTRAVHAQRPAAKTGSKEAASSEREDGATCDMRKRRRGLWELRLGWVGGPLRQSAIPVTLGEATAKKAEVEQFPSLASALAL